MISRLISTLVVGVFVGGIGLFPSLSASAGAGEVDRLWVYASVNFQVDSDVDDLIDLLSRAKEAGYNGAAITDYKFGNLQERPENYYRNLIRTRAAADRIGIEIIPIVMQIGYSNSILQNNPNLAAGLPVKDCEFVVRDGKATIASTRNLLEGGGFETAAQRAPLGWDWIDDFGTMTTLDPSVMHTGDAALLMQASKKSEDSGGNCRVVKRVTLKPFHQYRFTMWAKTDNLKADEFKFMPLSVSEPSVALNHADLGVQPTQDWTRHQIVFNSLQHTDVNVYLGLWGAQSGRVWIDDVRLEEVGGVNLLRRDGCPIHVRSNDGSIDYVEGRDFFAWHDPSLGRIPYAGEFDDDHDAPMIQLTKGSRIEEGATLRVSFFHTVIIHDGQVGASLVADEVFDLLRREIIQLDKYFQPKRYFMSHDEIRVAGWDELARGRPSGKLLADNVRRCERLIHELRPDAEVLVWSDMFDPHHNARDEYYLVRGSLKDSWTGLDPNVAIVNWNSGSAPQSLRFFAGRGHSQIIAGYYDDGVQQNVQQWKAAAFGVNDVVGYMYTTWTRNYDELESFAEKVLANE